MRRLSFMLWSCTVSFIGCESMPIMHPVETIPLSTTSVSEVSGFVYSDSLQGQFWAVNDSGNGPFIHLMDSLGNVKRTIRIGVSSNRDWEALAYSDSHLWIADIGDNAAKHRRIRVYRVNEHNLMEQETLLDVVWFRMMYPDGPMDSEAFFIDPITKDWFFLSKREKRTEIHRYGYPQSSGKVNTLERLRTSLDVRYIVDAAISKAGDRVLLKTLMGVHLWNRFPNESIEDMFERPSDRSWRVFDLSEAIQFTPDGDGFVTLNETLPFLAQQLKRYRFDDGVR